HRPLVIAWPLLRIPGRRVARPVIDEVQLGIIGNPAPRGAAADLPLIALPSGEARLLADRLTKVSGSDRIHERLPVGTQGIASPNLLAVLDVIGGEIAAHAEFAAGNADEHLFLDDKRRRRACF